MTTSSVVHILVVDNEPDMRLLFEQSFKKEIYSKSTSFHFAESGEKALALLHHSPIDLVLILSDIHMPGISGIELLKKLKHNYSDLPVCIITAYGDTEQTKLAQKFHADEIIHKPINFKHLKEVISKFLISNKVYRL